jgi:hypothetical protein
LNPSAPQKIPAASLNAKRIESAEKAKKDIKTVGEMRKTTFFPLCMILFIENLY